MHRLRPANRGRRPAGPSRRARRRLLYGGAIVQVHPLDGHELDRYDLPTEELRRVVAPWIAACHARQVSGQIINEVSSLIGYDLDQLEGSVRA